MLVWQGAQPISGLFRREIALGFGHHLVADHELAHRRRTEQGRIKMGV